MHNATDSNEFKYNILYIYGFFLSVFTYQSTIFTIIYKKKVVCQQFFRKLFNNIINNLSCLSEHTTDIILNKIIVG